MEAPFFFSNESIRDLIYRINNTDEIICHKFSKESIVRYKQFFVELNHDLSYFVFSSPTTEILLQSMLKKSFQNPQLFFFVPKKTEAMQHKTTFSDSSTAITPFFSKSNSFNTNQRPPFNNNFRPQNRTFNQPSNSSASINNRAAFNVTFSAPTQQQQRPRSPVKCFKCGRFGHVASTCRWNAKAQQNFQQFKLQFEDAVKLFEREDAANQQNDQQFYDLHIFFFYYLYCKTFFTITLCYQI